MTDKKVNCRFLWQKTEKGEAKLLRIYGQSAHVILPEVIAGYPLTVIGAYCFSAYSHLPADGKWEDTSVYIEGVSKSDAADDQLYELSGSCIEKVFLPDTIWKIENCAFYHCTSLRELSIGCNTRKFGSDVFMNCRKLDKISVRCGVERKTGIRQILNRISSDIEVYFYGEEGLEAVLLYPEYSEAYDEITPAHVFGRKITGEGFRARQCFDEDIVNLQQYDEVFPKACVDESEKTLARMAMNRLCCQTGLTNAARDYYEAYLKAHAGTVGIHLIHEKNIKRLLFLCENRYFSKQEMAVCIANAAKAEWPEGTAYLMRWNQEYYADAKEGRYEFDEF